MFCKHCGKPIPEIAYCKYCGKPTGLKGGVGSPFSPLVRPPVLHAAKKSTAKSVSIVLVLVLILGGMFCFIIVNYLFTPDSAGINTSPKTTKTEQIIEDNSAVANTSDKDYEYVVINEKVEIRNYIGSEPNVIMPNKILGLPVTSIGNYAFTYCSDILESVVIPGSVKSIGANAFRSNSNLARLTILNGVESIGESAFSGCKRLEKIVFPKSVTTIGDSAFIYCSGLTDVIIPGNVKSIGPLAFYAEADNNNQSFITNLSNLTIEEGVENIGYSAFYGCFKLKSVTIPGSVKSIGADAFSLDLETAYLGNYVAPPQNSYLTSLTIMDGVETIGEGAFEACFNITSVKIPGSVKTIESYTFHGCTGLTDVIIEDGVKSIRSYSFRGCSNLTNVTIPNNLINLDSSAFEKCPNAVIARK